ncbi:transposase [Thiocapsa bogorovii]|uniref:transposase n=1 Tax=Thiocapsa bogorovii TaxID=521689 RepID=UPI001E567002|nr:transposase [Thiocapsa bogorovii]UHD16689.1 transposase [Thiocapsa bogorovii]
MSNPIPHPQGEPETTALVPHAGPVAVDTFGGRVHVEWDAQAAVTPLGQLPFFTEFLRLGGRFDAWVESCPLKLTSPNAPSTRDVLGTAILAVLSGHQRDAHISALRGDTINAALLGMEAVVSEDSVRRNLGKLDEADGVAWLQNHLDACVAPVPGVPWILDTDVTVKPLYGHQEGALKGYNPHKPGRPSHTDHTYFVAGLRLILDVEVLDGNQTASKYSAPGLWELLARLPRAHWPLCIRGDRDWGTQANMARAEQEGIPYLFKLRMTSKVKQTVERLMRDAEWCDAGQGWQGAETTLRLSGWSRARRAVVLRRRIKADLAVVEQGDPEQLRLSFAELTDETIVYEYAVLVTSLPHEILSVAQLYRDRADAENPFDELKNHWGWGGFTTRDIKRCRFMARITALTYNWWSLFVRLADPTRHTEAITSRPLLLSAPARLTRHGGQRRLTISHPHAEAGWVEATCREITAFFNTLRRTAEQLSPLQRWYRLLSRALVKYLNGRQLQPPAVLPAPA